MTAPNTTLPTATHVLAQGFFDDPMLSFLFPDSGTRLDALIEWFHLFVTDGFQRGTVTLTAASEGAIIWYPAELNLFDAKFDALLSHATSVVERFAGSDGVIQFEQLGQAVMGHAPEVPHLEVFWLALQPAARGQGLGGYLLQSALQQADRAQVSAHLVSSNPRNISFYERYGFRPLQSLMVGNVLPLTQMWRDPQIPTPN